MLKVFRDNLKYLSWILWVVIGLFVLFVFVDFGTGIGGQQGSTRAVAAHVGDRVVTVEDFQREYRQLEQMYRQLYGEQFTPELAEQMRLPMQALERAVTSQILLAEGERLGLDVTDAEVRERILEEPIFRDEQGNFVGAEKYRQILSNIRYTPATFEKEIRQELLRQKLQDVLRAGIYVSDAEVERAHREQVEKASIRYIQLPRTRFIQEAQVTPAEIQSYFQSHKDEYRLPEQREGAYLLVETDALRSQVQVPEDKLRAEYEARKQEFSHEEQIRARHILVRTTDPASEAAARTKLEAARKRIEGGADFGVVAGEVSEEPGAKERGGDLNWFGRGQMVKPFEDAAFALKEGEVSGVVETVFGYHIIKLEERRAQTAPGGASANEQVRARHILIRYNSAPRSPNSPPMAPRDTARQAVEEEKRKRVLDEVIARRRIRVAEDYPVGPEAAAAAAAAPAPAGTEGRGTASPSAGATKTTRTTAAPKRPATKKRKG